MCHALPSAIQVIKPHMSHMADRIYIYKESQIYVLQNQRNPHHHKTAFVAWPLAAMSFASCTTCHTNQTQKMSMDSGGFVVTVEVSLSACDCVSLSMTRGQILVSVFFVRLWIT